MMSNVRIFMIPIHDYDANLLITDEIIEEIDNVKFDS